MEPAAREGSNERTIALRIVCNPRRLHLQDAEWHSIGDHFPDFPQAGASCPLDDGMRVVAERKRPLRADSAQPPPRRIQRGPKQNCVLATLNGGDVQRPIDSMVAITALRAVQILAPQVRVR